MAHNQASTAEELGLQDEGIFKIDEDGPLAIEAPAENPGGGKKTIKRVLKGLGALVAGVAIFFIAGMFGGGEEIITIQPSPIQVSNNNKLVHITGVPAAQDFTDPMFNVTANGLALERVVEMYQWAEDTEQAGNFIKQWSPELIAITDPTAKIKGVENPSELPFLSEKWQAEKPMLGSFNLSSGLVNHIVATTNYGVTPQDLQKLNPDGQKAFKLYQGMYYFGINPDKPNIGDLRISFKVTPAAPVTILAKQVGDSLEPYLGENGPIEILRSGNLDVAAISQGVNLGGNSRIPLIGRAIAVLVMLAGVFIIVGKVPLGKKKPKDAPKQKAKKTEPEEIVPAIIAEEESPIQDVAASSASEEDFLAYKDEVPKSSEMVEDAPEYKDPVYMAKNQPEPVKAPNVAIDTIKPTAAPAPLEFSPSVPDKAEDINVTSQLQQFGIISEPELSSLVSPSSAPNMDSSLGIVDNSQGTEQLEIPAEVEILSDFDLNEPHEDVQERAPTAEWGNIGQHAQPEIAAFTPPDVEITPVAPEVHDAIVPELHDMPALETNAEIPLEPRTIDFISESGETDLTIHAPQPVPEPVDYSSEIQNYAAEIGSVYNPGGEYVPEGPAYDTAEPAVSIEESPYIPPLPNEPADTYAYNNTENANYGEYTENYVTEEALPQQNEAGEEEENWDEGEFTAPPLPPLPPLPDYYADSGAVSAEENNYYADLPPDLLPQGDYSQPQAEENWNSEEENNEGDGGIPPMPPLPDYNSLFASYGSAVAEPAYPASPAPAAPGIFDLPNIPDNFDPTAEMPPLEGYQDSALQEENDGLENGAVADEDEHSPFGDLEDPFANPEENK